jgi:ABC-type nitrate/sulfonate/bicarbonate transport system ATPase subunit
MLLARSPQVLCLDEPFGALDALTRQEMYSLLLSLWDGGAPSALGGRTVVLITHDVHEAILLADRLLIAQRRPVTDVVSVDVSFPRPRTFDRMFDSDARAVAEHVFQLLLPLSAMH